MVTKSSKKGWRTIKLTEELKNFANNTTAAELKQKVDTLFHEDTVGGLQGVSKKLQREISLLSKTNKVSVAVSELPLLEKSIAKVGKSPIVHRANKNIKVHDIWADVSSENKLKTNLPSTVLRRESFAPAVLPACAGMSVNPRREDFEALLINEADREMKKIRQKKVYLVAPQGEEVLAASEQQVADPVGEVSVAVKNVLRKTRAQKVKESKHKQMLREHEQRRKMKELRRKGQDKAAIAAELAEQASRRELRLKTTVGRIIDEAAGKTNGLSRGAGGRLLATPTRIGSTEIAQSLRRIVPAGDIVLERRASLLNRRMIEQVPETNAEYKEKVRFAKLDAIKAVKMMDKSAHARCVLLG